MPDVTIPSDLLPADGRFGCGPSKVRPEQVAYLAGAGAALLGTSHRQAPVKNLVGRVRSGLADLFRLPGRLRGRHRQRRLDRVLGCGGASRLIEKRSENLVFGEFGGKFAAAAKTPWLEAPHVIEAPGGSRSEVEVVEGVDVYAWPHNETSTGVMAPVRRVARRRRRADRHRRDERRGRRRLRRSRGRRLLLRPAEELRLRRRPVVRPVLPRRPRARRAHRRERPLHPRVPQHQERGRQLAPQPDAQHPGDRHPRCCSRTRSSG